MIICMRVADFPVLIDGAVKRTCHVCLAEVWVSGAMVSHVDSGELEPTCMRCLPGLLATMDNHEAMIHPDQVEELRALGVMKEARMFVDTINRITKKGS